MNYLELPELSVIESSLDTWMFETQKLYETAVKEYIKFKENHIDCQIKYEKRFAEVITSHKEKGQKVTIIKEIAKKECLDEYKNMLTAEANKKHYSMYIVMFENRINMLKYLMRRKYGEMQ